MRKKTVTYYNVEIHVVVLNTAEECYSCDCRSSTDVLLNANSHILTLIWKVLLWSDQFDAGLALRSLMESQERQA